MIGNLLWASFVRRCCIVENVIFYSCFVASMVNWMIINHKFIYPHRRKKKKKQQNLCNKNIVFGKYRAKISLQFIPSLGSFHSCFFFLSFFCGIVLLRPIILIRLHYSGIVSSSDPFLCQLAYHSIRFRNIKFHAQWIQIICYDL